MTRRILNTKVPKAVRSAMNQAGNNGDGKAVDRYGRNENKADEQAPEATLCNAVVGKKELSDMSPKEIRQHRFIQAYKTNLFNITKACKEIGVDRSRFYRWKEEPGFREMLNNCGEELKDFILHQLLTLVAEKNMPVCIFMGKALCGLNENGQQNLVIEDKRDEMTNAQRDEFVKTALENEMKKSKWQEVLDTRCRHDPEQNE